MVSKNYCLPEKMSVKDKTTERMNGKTSTEDELKSFLDGTETHREVLEEHI